MLGHGRAGFGVAGDRSLTERNIRLQHSVLYSTRHSERKKTSGAFPACMFTKKGTNTKCMIGNRGRERGQNKSPVQNKKHKQNSKPFGTQAYDSTVRPSYIHTMSMSRSSARMMRIGF